MNDERKVVAEALRAIADVIDRLELGEPPERILRYPEIARRLGISEAAARKRGARGDFREVGDGEVGVIESELNAHIRSMPSRKRHGHYHPRPPVSLTPMRDILVRRRKP